MGDMLFVVHRDRSDLLDPLRRNFHELSATVVLDRRVGTAQGPGHHPAAGPDRRGRDITTDLRQLGFALVSRPETGPDEIAHAAGTPGGVSVPPDVVALLEGVPLLKEFTRRHLELLAPHLRVQKMKPGQVLFREGDRGEEMFFVAQGTIVISKTVVGDIEEVLARMTRADFFGEMSLFGCLQRSATARAETAVVVLGLDRSGLEQVIELSSRAGLAFFRAMVDEFTRRLARTDDLVAEVTRWGLEATGLEPTVAA